METPVFEEIDPASDCGCTGCVRRRLSGPARPALAVTPRAVIVVATASAATAALGAAHAPPAQAAPRSPARAVPAGDEPETPQGGSTALHGPPGRPATPVKAPATSRADIIKRAKTWVAAKVPYSMTAFWSDGYRQDCSGFVSMAWGLPGNEWTGTLGRYGTRIAKEDLQPGDILLFHNPVDPQKGSHVVIFGGWTDYTHSYYIAYEQTRPGTRRQATPYAYWTHSDRYLAYRYAGVTTGTQGAPPEGTPPGGMLPDGSTPFPGRAHFGPGANNTHVTLLGTMLVERGAKRFYTSGPGPRWSDADRRATQAFQQAQGWKGADADGLPGPDTWTLLITGKGRDIVTGTPGPPAPSSAAPSSAAPAYPGRAYFTPGAENTYVTRLGEQLVRKGYGRYYGAGPTPRWGDADRRAVEAFQRAQGWRGAAADGYPGPETWRRLFS